MSHLPFLLLLAAPACSAQTYSCPASPSNAPGKDFHGQNLSRQNFSKEDLTNANFSGATLTGVYFGSAILTGANFSGATIAADPANSFAGTDFSFANLDSACFLGAKFVGSTYFTYSTITCADFSNVDLSTQNLIFGDAFQLDTTRQCRPAFRSSTMNCELVSHWQHFDLTSANVKACFSLLTGLDLSKAWMPGVDLSDAVLDNAKFALANLTQANLNRASLRHVDFSNATLFGVQMNNANLTGATMYRAFLANNTGGNVSQSASLRQAHLKNVNLSFAELSGVDFTLANFYGDNPAGNSSCSTTLANYQGFACQCASAHGATMLETTFTNAYLFGVDFTGSSGAGVSFQQAVLTGANFSGASLTASAASGKSTSMNRALLQGANLGTATLTNVDLSDSFVDFRAGGNNIYIFLDGGNHNDFTCSPASSCNPATKEDVCVEVNYPQPTTAPAANPSMICPDGSSGNCGANDPSGGNTKWKSSVSDPGNPPTGIPPAWYDQDATFTKAANATVVCKGKGENSSVVLW